MRPIPSLTRTARPARRAPRLPARVGALAAICFALALTAPQALRGQSATVSPYSVFGFGQLQEASNSRNWALGGTAYAQFEFLNINPRNPALLSDISLTTIDAGGWYGETRLQSDGRSARQRIGSINHLSVAFPTRKHFTLAAGILPYSAIGFQVTDQRQSVLGGDTLTINTANQAEGGLSEFYFGAGAHFFRRRLAAGATFTYLFGNSNGAFTSSISNVQGFTAFYVERSYRGVGTRLGLSYTDTLSRSRGGILGRVGLVYQPSIGLRVNERRSQQPSSSLTQLRDTTFDGRLPDTDIPNQLGVGFSVVKPNKWSVAVDVTYQNWQDWRFGGSDTLQVRTGTRAARGNGQWGASFGVEWTPNFQSPKYLQRVEYRLGAYWRQGQLAVQEGGTDEFLGGGYGDFRAQPEYGVRAGVGLPLNRQYSRLNLGLGYAVRGTDAPGLLRESGFQVFLGLNFNEAWFVRRAYD